MSIDKKHKVPALRFPGFNGEWATKVLRTITDIYDGTHQTPKYEKSGVPFYSVEHVTADQFSETKFISEEVFEQERKRVVIEKGDILMTRIGSIGVAKYIDWDVRASFYVSLALIKVSDEVIGRFVTQYIMTESFQRELWKKTIHVAFPIKINLGEIGNCIIHIPEKKEQQKIADFLASVDTKIEQLAEKKSLLEQYKKGMMQQLFSQARRFKDEDGNDFPDWEEFETLGGICKKVTSGGTPTSTRNDYYGGDIPWLRTQEIDYKIIQDTGIKITEKGLKNSSAKWIPANCVIVAMYGATAAKAAINGIPLTTNQACCNLNIDPKKANYKYVFYWVCNEYIRLKSFAQGGQSNLNAGKIKSYKIPVPPLPEQQKIADFLSAIDRKMTLTDTQLTKAKAFKKGLLQRMFA